MNNVNRLIAAGALAVGAMGVHASDDDDNRGCKLSTLKGTYSFSSVGVHDVSAIPVAGFSGFIYFDGKGDATLQTTDNDGGGAGAAPHLTTVTTEGLDGVTQTETGACVFNLQATLAVTPANCAYPVNFNLFVSAEGNDFNAITTGPFPSLITTFGGKRFAKSNILVKADSVKVTPTACGG